MGNFFFKGVIKQEIVTEAQLSFKFHQNKENKTISYFLRKKKATLHRGICGVGYDSENKDNQSFHRKTKKHNGLKLTVARQTHTARQLVEALLLLLKGSLLTES